jgi:hypothetical protein
MKRVAHDSIDNFAASTGSFLGQIIPGSHIPRPNRSFPFFNSSMTCKGVRLSRCSFVKDPLMLARDAEDFSVQLSVPASPAVHFLPSRYRAISSSGNPWVCRLASARLN